MLLTLLVGIAVVAVLFVAAAVATRDGDVLREAPRDAADLDLPKGPLQAEDVTAVRFSMATRGYRMSEVDALLELVTAELHAREETQRGLEAELAQARSASPLPGGSPAAD